MRIYAKNGLPINCRANVIFMTDKLVHIDSLVHPKTPIDPSPIIIRAAPVESNGKVDSSKAAISTYSFTLSKTQFRALLDRQATKALFRANLTTTNAPATNVVIYPEYRLKVKVGLRIKTRIKI